jgi:voltage-gated potassium channel
MSDAFRTFRSNDGYQRWERWTDWPLVGLALIFLLVLILPLAEPLSRFESKGLDIANVMIWAVFALDYLILLYLSLDRRRYVRTHILELVVVAVPFLRPFRLLRLFAIVASTTRRAGGRVVQRVTVFAVCVAVIVMATSAVVVYDAEKNAPGHTIKTLGDSMWWAISTLTTVGYGDVYPVSPWGRLMATLLMLTGISLVGTVTAAIASWFVHIVRSTANAGNAPILAAEQDLSAQISALAANLEFVSQQLQALRAEVAAQT